MWAIIDYDGESVIGCMPPDVDITLPDVQKELNGRTLIMMTQENSPAHIPGKYINNKFVRIEDSNA